MTPKRSNHGIIMHGGVINASRVVVGDRAHAEQISTVESTAILNETLEPKQNSVRLVYLYSSYDDEYRHGLEGHLAGLERQGIISSWSDHCILPGQEVRQASRQQLFAADIVLI